MEIETPLSPRGHPSPRTTTTSSVNEPYQKRLDGSGNRLNQLQPSFSTTISVGVVRKEDGDDDERSTGYGGEMVGNGIRQSSARNDRSTSISSYNTDDDENDYDDDDYSDDDDDDDYYDDDDDDDTTTTNNDEEYDGDDEGIKQQSLTSSRRSSGHNNIAASINRDSNSTSKPPKRRQKQQERELCQCKESLRQAKNTIASLIEQISDYQSLVEEEKEREKELFTQQIDELHDELDAIKRDKNLQAKTNVQNLETLMKEIDLIEESNNELRVALENEQKQHYASQELLKKYKEEQQLLLQQHQQLQIQPSTSSTSLSPTQISQVTMEFKLTDGVVSNIKLVSAKPHNPPKSPNLKSSSSSSGAMILASSISHSSSSSSFMEVEEERNHLLRKLLEEKENHEKTFNMLKEERTRSESNRSSADELVKKIKELIKLHSSTLKELEEEREISQQRADQISDLRLKLSRPTNPNGRLQRTHSQYLTLKRTHNNQNHSLFMPQTIKESPSNSNGHLDGADINITKTTPNDSNSKSSSSHHLLLSPTSTSISTLTTIHTTPPTRTPYSQSCDENLHQIGNHNATNTATSTTTTISASTSNTNLAKVEAMIEQQQQRELIATNKKALISEDDRLLRRSSASMDLCLRRYTSKASMILGTNENMVAHLSVDPAPAPIQCLAEVGKHVWAGCSDGQIRVIDKETTVTVATRAGHSPHGVYTLLVVGKTVWSSSRDSKIKVWNSKNGKLIKDLDGHSSHVTSLLAVGNNVWSISADMAIRVWSSSSYRCIKKIETKSYLVSMAKFNNQIWIGTESAILRWDAQTYEPIDILHGHKKMVHCMIPVDNYIWSCSSDNIICVWDPNTGKLVSKITDHKSRVFYLLRVNNQIWSCAWDKTIKIHSIDTLSLVKEIEPVHRDALSSLITIRRSPISPLQVWSGSWDHTIIIWKTSDTPNNTINSIGSGAIESISNNNTISNSKSSTANNNNGGKQPSWQSSSAIEHNPNNKRASMRLSMFFTNKDKDTSNISTTQSMHNIILQSSNLTPNLTNAIQQQQQQPMYPLFNGHQHITNVPPPLVVPAVPIHQISKSSQTTNIVSPPSSSSSSSHKSATVSPRNIFSLLSPRSQSAMALTSPRKEKEKEKHKEKEKDKGKDKDKDKEKEKEKDKSTTTTSTPPAGNGDNLSPKCISQPSPTLVFTSSNSLSHHHSNNELIPPHILNQHQHLHPHPHPNQQQQLPPTLSSQQISSLPLPPPPTGGGQPIWNQLPNRIIMAHDLVKQNISHSVTCAICNGKISTNWGGKKQVFHCNNCKEYYHNGECVESSLSNNCSCPK